MRFRKHGVLVFCWFVCSFLFFVFSKRLILLFYLESGVVSAELSFDFLSQTSCRREMLWQSLLPWHRVLRTFYVAVDRLRHRLMCMEHWICTLNWKCILFPLKIIFGNNQLTTKMQYHIVTYFLGPHLTYMYPTFWHCDKLFSTSVLGFVSSCLGIHASH